MKYTMLINGESVSASEHFEVKDPATGEVIGECPIATKAQLDLSLIHI